MQHFKEGMENRIYPPELQFNKTNGADIEHPFVDLHSSTSNEFVSSNIFNNHDIFDFGIVNFLLFWVVTITVLSFILFNE